MAALSPAPVATYRLQLNAGFGFDRVAEIAEYLAALGVSHVYLSPILTAAPGSAHGYDVVDHASVNAELGGEAGYARMCEALASHGLGQLLDIVPNHMAIGTPDNRLWWDVLENGPASAYAAFFDVDWNGGSDTRVLLPVLGEAYVDALDHKRVRVVREGDSFAVAYHEHRWPAAPRSLAPLLRAAADGAQHDELAFIADALLALPAPAAADPDSVPRRQRDKAVLFAYLARLLAAEPELAARVDARIAELNADGVALDAWLERQNFRLAHWRNAVTELGYRRFFDVQSLAGLRVEAPRVFAHVHARVLRWLRDGTVAGVRVDHVDGLRDPEQYLRALRAAAPEAWIVVEKILVPGEALRGEWPVDGTTGYEFTRLLDQVFVDPRGEAVLGALDRRARRDARAWDELAVEAKLQICDELLASERERLTDLAYRALARRREFRDCTRHALSAAVRALLASYPVYRTYVRKDAEPAEDERALIAGVAARAAQLAPDVDARVFTALGQLLSLDVRGELETELALRVQQVTGAVHAKAIEDTLFYRHARLCALNEVGGSPEAFGVGLPEFHAALSRAQSPRALLASATHDTKRGEDTRARLLALSEVPDAFAACVERWSARTRAYRDPRVDAAIEHLFYQTLIGAFPLSAERAQAYMEKAAREAKRHTSWIRPDAEYEAALRAFVGAAIADRALTDEVAAFVARLSPGALVTSLARTLIKLSAPGVPDLYQGTELWDLHLVDPDNRAPVDFAARARALERVQRMSPEQVLAELDAGTPKLWLIWKTLALRKQRPEAFIGAYRPLIVSGADAERVVAFARDADLVVVVTRFNQRGAARDCDARVELPGGAFEDALTGERVVAGGDGRVPARALFARFPVALLVRTA
jgi:(1->4)-alpha-D-glucan 1-alpha-D-glucosylmutase